MNSKLDSGVYAGYLNYLGPNDGVFMIYLIGPNEFYLHYGKINLTRTELEFVISFNTKIKIKDVVVYNISYGEINWTPVMVGSEMIDEHPLWWKNRKDRKTNWDWIGHLPASQHNNGYSAANFKEEYECTFAI